MSIIWGNWAVRVYAADAWISLAPRFAAERPEIVDRIGEILTDHHPAVRLKAAQNLHVICVAASERMWEMGERIAEAETNAHVLTAYLKDLNIELIDFKLEFGKTSDGTIVLADEISPDTCRFWDSVTHEKLDKDRFRRDLGGVEDAYHEIMKRLMGE